MYCCKIASACQVACSRTSSLLLYELTANCFFFSSCLFVSLSLSWLIACCLTSSLLRASWLKNPRCKTLKRFLLFLAAFHAPWLKIYLLQACCFSFLLAPSCLQSSLLQACCLEAPSCLQSSLLQACCLKAHSCLQSSLLRARCVKTHSCLKSFLPAAKSSLAAA